MKEGIHVMHLFYRVDRMAWAELDPAGSAKALEKLEAFLEWKARGGADAPPAAEMADRSQ